MKQKQKSILLAGFLILSLILANSAFAAISNNDTGGTTTTTPRPAVISDVKVESVTANSAKVRWSTDIAASSMVEYGQTASMLTVSQQRCDSTGLVIDHCVYLTGLVPQSNYYYSVHSDLGYYDSTSLLYTFITSSATSTTDQSTSGSPGTTGTNITAPSTTADTTNINPASKIISGKITFNDSLPVTDALIYAHSSSGISASASTDASGKYYLSVSGEGEYLLGIKPKDLNTSQWSYAGQFGKVSFSSENIQESKELNYTVNKDSLNLTVKAVDLANKPLPGVYVSFDNAGSLTVPGQKTDNNGKAKFNLTRGAYLIFARIDPQTGYINPPQQSITVNASGNKDLIFVFNKSEEATLVNLSGTTRLKDAGLVDAHVWAFAESGESFSTTAPEGKFFFKVKPNSVWHIGAGKQIGENAYKAAETTVNMGVKDVSLDLVLTLIAALPKPAVFTSSSNANIQAKTTDGAQVTVPANSAAVADNLTLHINPTVEAPVQAARLPVSVVYDVSVKDSRGNKLTTFTKPLEVKIPYDKQTVQSLGIDENKLKPSYFDEALSIWIEIPDFSVDVVNKLVIARVSHLTRFAIVMPADITPPSAPSDWEAITSSSIAVNFSWTNPDRDFKYVKIYRSEAEGNLGVLIQTNITSGNFTDTDVIQGKPYYYVLRAVDPAGNESTNVRQIWVKAIAGSISPLPGQMYYKGPKQEALANDLKYGNRGEAVSKLQQFLYDQKLLKVKPTGYFGNLTRQAVKDFQALKNLPITGVVEGVTRSAVNILLAGG